ncbi:MAG: DUF1727 domain-containing protein [Acidimicrobiales bacterium]
MKSGLRTRTAVGLGQAAGRASRLVGRGTGSVIGGRVTLALAPGALAGLARAHRVIMVSGTNGKTTTTRLLSSALAQAGHPVVTNVAGANMLAGLVAAFSAQTPGNAPGLAALEVDEGWVPAAMDAVQPEGLILLNLSRDQLDRVSEVRMTAAKWRRALMAHLGVSVVANADDPMVVWAVGGGDDPTGHPGGRKVVWVGAGQPWRSDAVGCPQCDGRLSYGGGDASQWWCECGLARPPVDVSLDSLSMHWQGRGSWPLALALPGEFNRANAAMAAVGASLVGIEVDDALAVMVGTTDVAGRYQLLPVGEGRVRLLMAKNPAGWVEMFDVLAPSPSPVVLAINARTADGTDPSWLWDVPFESLAGRQVWASGDRCWDLGVRLTYAEVDHQVIKEPALALAQAAGTGATVDFVGNYTAFQDVRRFLDPDSGPGSSSSVGTWLAKAGRGSNKGASVSGDRP